MTLPTPPISDLLYDPGYPALKGLIIETTGLGYYADKDEDLVDRMNRRLEATKQPDCEAYRQLLNQPGTGEAELDRLIEELTVGETSFFRHAELFEGLRETVLPELLDRNRSCRRLRIWSAGCSIGAESYSLAILLSQEFADRLAGWDVSILGTDINRKFLARAREGVFRTWDFRGTETRVGGCFNRHGDEWAIHPEHRRWVSFQHHNLVQHPFPSLLHNLGAFDLILCRNVLIYFNAETTVRLARQFYECLADGGWLLVGHAEPNVKLFRDFHTINVPGAVLYQRRDPAPRAIAGAGLAASPPVLPMKLAAGSCPGTKPLEGSSAPSRKAPHRPPSPAMSAKRASLERGGDDLSRVCRLADGGDLESAMRTCEALVAEHPMNPSLHLRLAMLAEQLGFHRPAEMSLRRALYLSPDNAFAQYFAGLLDQKRGRRAGALQAYGRALGLLASRHDDDAVPDTEGLVVCELRQLIQMQQEVLHKP